MPARLPVIFVLDMDECIIGKAGDLLKCREMTNYIMNACRSEKIASCNNIIVKNKRSSLDTTFMTPELFRPGLAEALRDIKALFDGRAEFFIFSAGTAGYVRDMVDLIEAHTQQQFNRPLLTRDNTVESQTGTTEKSLIIYGDTFIKALLPRYPALKKQANVDIVKQSHIIYIDDNNWTEDKSRDKFIQVTSYIYTPVFDILLNVPHEIRVMPFVQDYLKKYPAYFEAFVEPEPSVHITQRNMQYHLFMANLYNSYSQANTDAMNDRLCPEFVAALKLVHKRSHPFSPKNVELLRKTLREKKVAV